MHTPQPAPQLSEATFRTYEPYLHQAVKAWPDETKWSPDQMINEATQRSLSPHTFAARLRDSVVSFQRFAWKSYIDREKFTSIFGQFAVAYDQDGSVWFRNRGRRGRPVEFAREAKAVDAGAQSPVRGVWDNWSNEEVHAAALLLSHQRIVGPVIFTGEVPAEVITTILSVFDVGLFFDKDRNQTILS